MYLLQAGRQRDSRLLYTIVKLRTDRIARRPSMSGIDMLSDNKGRLRAVASRHKDAVLNNWCLSIFIVLGRMGRGYHIIKKISKAVLQMFRVLAACSHTLTFVLNRGKICFEDFCNKHYSVRHAVRLLWVRLLTCEIKRKPFAKHT